MGAKLQLPPTYPLPPQGINGPNGFVPNGGISLQPFNASASSYSGAGQKAAENAYNMQKQAVDNYNKMMLDKQTQQPQQTENPLTKIAGKAAKYGNQQQQNQQQISYM